MDLGVAIVIILFFLESHDEDDGGGRDGSSRCVQRKFSGTKKNNLTLKSEIVEN